ncbi:MAG: hypothetical protein ACXWPP_21945 [Ktedonobacteraceae bacterium]
MSPVVLRCCNGLRMLEAPFKIRNLWLAPLMGLIAIYFLPSLYGMRYFDTDVATELTGIVAVGVVFYLLFYTMLAACAPDPRWGNKLRLARFDAGVFIQIVAGVYFVFFLYVIATAERIALWESLKGTDSQTIALARESLFKARIGWEKSLAYINLLLTSAFVPYALALAYLKKLRYRHGFLVAFVITLLVSLEKSGVIKAFLPLIVLAFSGYLSRRSGYVFVACTLSLIIGVTALTKMGSINPAGGVAVQRMEAEAYQAAETRAIEAKAEAKLAETKLAEAKLAEAKLASTAKTGAEAVEASKLVKAAYEKAVALERMNALAAAEVAAEAEGLKKSLNRFQVVDTRSPLGYVVNRAFWIPYVTAYDWLLYFNKNQHSAYLLGRTNQTIALLTQQDRFNMDQAVFQFEFGNSDTGSSNTVFLIDAFVNFGWYGVVFSAFLVALLTYLIRRIDNPAAQACFYFYIFQLLVGALFSVMLGGGLLLFALMAILTRSARVAENAL